MARLRSHKAQNALIRQYSPPPDLAQYVGQVKTPRRSALFALRALARFTRIFEEELDQKKVQKQYEWYTKRFHECRRLDGQMTRY